MFKRSHPPMVNDTYGYRRQQEYRRWTWADTWLATAAAATLTALFIAVLAGWV